MNSAKDDPVEPLGRAVKICLTGGPCGGKTTIQVALCDMFENLGWKVFRLPETATMLLGTGVAWYDLTPEEAKEFQLNLLRVMLTIEDTFTLMANSMAARGMNVMIICDRGAMDPGAYISRSEWTSVLTELNMDELILRDQRYDCVIHLVSSAIGAEKFYSSESNSTRYENLETAKKVDELLANQWIGHPNFVVVDNSTDFEAKKQRAFEAILNRIGLSDTRFGKGIVKKKYLLTSFNSEQFPPNLSYRDFEVRHDYLISSDDSTTRIRRRGNSNSFVHSITQQKAILDGQRVEIRRTIPHKEYEIFMSQRDQTHCPIIKNRWCFIWKERYYQIDRFNSPSPGLVLLEAYIVPSKNTHQDNHELPSFLEIERDVTDDKSYSMFNLSKI